MPLSTLWLKIGNADVRVFKQKTSNPLMIKDPILQEQANGEPVQTLRIVAKSHWLKVGTGEELIVETSLKDRDGSVVSQASALCILDNYKSKPLNGKAEEIDKKKMQYFLVNPDGSLAGEVAPFPPTERIEVLETPAEAKETGQAYWIPQSVIEQFLIHEVYELPAADPRNDVKLFKEAEAASKRDEIAILNFSNGGFSQHYGFLCPFFQEGKFVWLLKLSDKKAEYNFLRDIPAPAAALKQVKTLQTMPPIQNLLTIQRK